LYLVYGGANDMFAMLGAAAADPTNASALKDQAITTAVGNLKDILNTLAGAGATSFLVPNLPDLGSTPRLVGTPGQTFADMASKQFNAALDGMLASFDSLHPGAKTMELDVFAALNDALDPSNPTFPNKTTGCYPGDPFSPPPTTPTCTNPDKYVFWDDIHPTSAAHALLGAEAYSIVTVPEPRTWLVLVVGLALLFSIARMHRSARPLGPVAS
jgi:phospholipase/lecithinase/hemolysin